EAGASLIPRVSPLVLELAEQHAGIGMDRLLAKLAEARLQPRLVAPEDPRVALERLAQAARPGLGVGRAFASVLTPQATAQGVEIVRIPRDVMPRAVHVNRRLAIHGRGDQVADGTGDRAHVVAILGHCLLGRDSAVPPVRREQLAL